MEKFSFVDVGVDSRPFWDSVQGGPDRLAIDINVRRKTGSIFHYINGPITRESIESLRWLPTQSLLSPPLRTYSPSFSPRSARLSLSSPSLESRLENRVEMLEIRVNFICNWLHQQQLQRLWSVGNDEEGVMVKKTRDEYVCCPSELANHSLGFCDAVRQLNVKCALTVNTRTTKLILDITNTTYVPLDNGLRLQVLPGIAQLSRCQKNHFAAFIQYPPLLIVWDDDPAHIVQRVQDLEAQMMALIWKSDNVLEKNHAYSVTGAESTYAETTHYQHDTKWAGTRRPVLIQSYIVAATLALTCVALATGWRKIAIEIKIQRTWWRLVFLVLAPLHAWMGLFFFQTIPTCIAQVIGPVKQLRQNSKFYSGRPPLQIHRSVLPHVTVQCPVYKESLEAVIAPTIKSIKAAISVYEMQGGMANIFVNDDGMQSLDDFEARERRDFYEENNIGWVARPKHNAVCATDGRVFFRAGKFKKASNMNYGLNISIRIEHKLRAAERDESWTAEDESLAYDEALEEVVTEDAGRTWAAGNIRIGDYILLIDSDTRVPHDCLLKAVSELEQSPTVAILQFSSGVMNVTHSWFEKGITFFTNLVYTAIEFAVANGDVAPFVGHNAFLRWSAVQDVAYCLPTDTNYHMFWSENTVSEDFDMALRLQTSGYIIRLASYAGGGFKEGVSLTVYDELARWEKYAYGCSELIFHPLAQWTYKGPFTPLFRRFLLSNMPFPSKVTIVAYVGTYFAIGSSWLLTLLNYLAVGWYNGYLDHYYMESFRTYFSVLIVFSVIGNIALAVLRYRVDEQKLIPAMFENFKWVIFLAIFLGGISLHVSQAILCHLFSINMSWGATSKEVTNTSFFQEIPVILRKFRLTFCFCVALALAMIVLSGAGPLKDALPHDWQITQFTAIFPLALLVGSHALLPIVLNPGLMQFTF